MVSWFWIADHTASEVARILNEHGRATGAGVAFSAERVRWVRFSAGLPSLKERGWLTTKELAALPVVPPQGDGE